MTASKPAITLLLALTASHVCAQSDTIVSPRTITNAPHDGVSATEILDTSRGKFRGTGLRFISHTERDRDDTDGAPHSASGGRHSMG